MDTTTAAQAAEAKAAEAKYVKCPQCAAALAARKLMMGCYVCRGAGVVRKAIAAQWARRAEDDAAYLRRQSPHTCDPVKVAAALAAIWGAK